MASLLNPIVIGVALLSFGAASLPLAADVPIILRSEWKPEAFPKKKNAAPKNKKILVEKELTERNVDQLTFLTVHSTGIPRPSVSDVSGKMNSLRVMVYKGYSVTPEVFSYMAEIPYHYVILRDGAVDGKVAEGREDKYAAATNTRNSEYFKSIAKHLTVVLELKYVNKKNKNKKDELAVLPPTEAQLKSLAELVEQLARKHNIKAENIGYHQQYANSTCPGPELITATERIRTELIAKGL